MKRLSIGTKIILPILSLLIIISVVFVYLIIDLQLKKEVINQNISQTKSTIILTNDLSNIEKQIEVYVVSYYYQSDPTKLDWLKGLDKEQAKTVKDMEGYLQSPGGISVLNSYLNVKNDSKKIRENMIGSLQIGNPKEAKQDYSTWLLSRTNIDATIEDLVVFNTSALDKNISLFNQLADQTIILYICLLLFSSVLLVVSYIYFRKLIVDPIKKLTSEVKNIGGTDSDLDLDIITKDEIGTLGRTFQEMTKNLKENYSRLRLLAMHDGLTGLPNRKALEERMQELLSKEKGRPLAVLILDLDRFKNINDTLGHDVGDQLLREISTRLQVGSNPKNLISRFGGDEFVLLMPEPGSRSKVIAMAEKILASLESVFDIDGFSFYISGSIGIALSPEDGDTFGMLIKKADIALYHAKMKGRNRFAFYHSSLDIRTQDMLSLEGDLRRALQTNELELFYQPILNIETRAITGLEALIRWKHPSRGLILPREFIPLAEEIGLIQDLEKIALKQAIKEVSKLKELNVPSIPIYVNISPIHFEEETFVSDIKEIIKDLGGDPGSLGLEITETVAMRDIERSLAKISELQEFGLRISIDDFGTGYSSLSYIGHFPVTKLKIDRFFVKDIINHEHDSAIIRAIIAMAHNMNLTVVAEGVETIMQLAVLRSFSCDEAQGFLFSEALSAENLRKWMVDQCITTRNGIKLKEDPLLLIGQDRV